MPNVTMPSGQSRTNNYATISGETSNLTPNGTPKGLNNKANEKSSLTQTDGPEPGTNGGMWSRVGGGDGNSSKAKLLYGLISISQIFLFMSWSILAPFFPPEAAQQGASPSQVGIIFGIYSLIQFVTSPIWGKCIPVIGARVVFIVGYIITACVNIAFGFFDRTPPGNTFVITCLVARGVQGLGTSAVFTASMTMVAYTFPNAVGRLVGVLEVFTGVGLMIGPFIGGVLYEAGGYLLPFVTLGGLMILQSIVLIFILPADGYSDHQRKPGSFLALLNIPGTWVGVVSIVLAALSFTVLEPTLAQELEKFTLSAVEIGLVFLLLGFVYGCTSPFFGWLAEKRVSSRMIVICGSGIACIGFIMLGPWTPLNLPHTLPLTCVSIVFVSLAFGLSFAPAYQEILISATFNGMPSNLSTFSVLSGTFNSAYSLGSFLGPVIGGGLVQSRNFAFMTSLISLFNLIVGVSAIIFTSWEFTCGKRRRKCRILRRFEYVAVDATGEDVHLLSNESTQSV